MRHRSWLVLVGSIALFAGACGGDNTSSEADSSAATAAPADEGAEEASKDPASTEQSAVAEGDVVPSGDLAVAYSVGPITFNPHMSQPGPQYGHLDPIYDTFIRMSPGGALEPGLATEWGFVDGDGLVFEMTLREGVLFTDGEAFDAESAKANLEHGMALEGPRTVLLDTIDSVDVIDEFQIRLNLVEPTPTLPQTLSTMMGMVVSPSILDTPELESSGIGTGPYIFDEAESVPGDRYVFTANDDYWDEEAAGRPAVITLVVMTDGDARLNALRSGQLSGANLQAPSVQAAEADGVSVMSAPDKFWGFVLQDRAGERVPELAIPEVRQAMNLAIDRTAIVESLFFGLGSPTAQLWSPGDSHFSEASADAYPYDPEQAKRLLTDAGVDEFSFTAPVLPVLSQWAQSIQAYLRDVGIDMQLEVIEPGTLGAAASSGDWPVTGIVAGGVESAPTDTELFLAEDGLYNPYGTSDPELTSLIDQAQVETDDDARKALYQQISDYATENAWFLISHYTDAIIGHSPEVSGWSFRFEGSGVPIYRDLRIDS